VEATAQQPRRTLQDGRPSVWFGRLSELLLLMASFLQFGLLRNTRLHRGKEFNSAKSTRQNVLQRQRIKCTSVFQLIVLVYRHCVTLVEILPLISYNIICIQVARVQPIQEDGRQTSLYMNWVYTKLSTTNVKSELIPEAESG